MCILLILSAASSGWSESPKEELKGVKREIKAQRQLITKTRKVEAVVSTELQEIDQSLKQKIADLGSLDRDLRNVESNLDRTGHTIKQVAEESNRKKQEIEHRLVSLYKAGELGALRMFFSAESFPQMAENIRYMRSILENDKKLFAEYNDKIEELHRLKVSLEQDMASKERIKNGISLKKREIEGEKNKKFAYLVKVRQDRKGYETSLKELQANASRLQSMVERLEALSRRKLSSRHVKEGSRLKPLPELPPVQDRGFASQKGRMALPVRGNIVETYGKHKHPEFNSYTFSKGLSIAAGAGTDIKAIYDGSVIFADYFKGYGNMVIVDHGGGYFSLYAHASKIMKKVGAEVARNETLATVGDVDSAKGPMLYFEIRYQGKPVDPAGWVR
ncbi:MAG: peptidoglycan DD-metalloendopeptidase family protein [Oryzomonas sp.]|uniref:murein hydrolase activator EnvC family protein n=1 Tax=Oryzomonas sp. TaxID=2855186 RepID=UPI00284EA4F3|nr:peptidoglycan DD-metalloendopeptidase family protein [Oryzomonas sp.]MDR3579331.1 peptidoglycan DD-metalloendopeptidase family protein [Oryzomonas sp.]